MTRSLDYDLNRGLIVASLNHPTISQFHRKSHHDDQSRSQTRWIDSKLRKTVGQSTSGPRRRSASSVMTQTDTPKGCVGTSPLGGLPEASVVHSSVSFTGECPQQAHDPPRQGRVGRGRDRALASVAECPLTACAWRARFPGATSCLWQRRRPRSVPSRASEITFRWRRSGGGTDRR
jgi:hypothetical protein